MQPAPLIDNLARRLGHVEIAGKDARAADDHLARAPHRQKIAGGAHQGDLMGRLRLSRGLAEDLGAVALGGEGKPSCRFRHAPAADGRSRQALQLLDHIDGKRRTAEEHPLQAGGVETLPIGQGQESLEHGRHQRRPGNPLPLDQRQEPGGVEMLLKHDRPARRQGEGEGLDAAADMGHRQIADDPRAASAAIARDRVSSNERCSAG